MNTSPVLYRRVSAFAVTAVCLAALGAAEHSLRMRSDGAPPARPVADAPVRVVKAPPEPATGRLPVGACRTCAMGAGQGSL